MPYAGSAVTYPLASASSAQPNNPADLALDGTTSTFWVSGGPPRAMDRKRLPPRR